MFPLLIFVLSFQSCVVCGKSCRQENVSGGEGGDVILHVNQTGIRYINWILFPEGNVIVKTKPGRSIDDDDEVIKPFRGRLRSEDDGSLHIYRLSPQDQKIYKADIQTTEDDLTCVEFNLSVYQILSPRDIWINHTITRNDTCSLGLLCSMDKRDVTITWSSVHTGDINVTRGVLYVPPRGVNFTYICTAHNPVSNVSKTVIPGEYCESESGFKKTFKRVYVLGILGIIPILVLICIILTGIHCIQQKKRRRQNVEMTTYAQVAAPQRQQENLYHQNQEEKIPATGITTTYAEVGDYKRQQENPNRRDQGEKTPATEYCVVQHYTKKNPKRMVDEKEKISVETLYSTVGSPKGNKENGRNGACRTK